jgi:hypothetical protein
MIINGLDGPEIESRWGKIFRNRSDRTLCPPSLLYGGYRLSFLGVKQPGRGLQQVPLPSAEVKQRVELYHYFSSEPSWPALERDLPYTFLPFMIINIIPLLPFFPSSRA